MQAYYVIRLAIMYFLQHHGIPITPELYNVDNSDICLYLSAKGVQMMNAFMTASNVLALLGCKVAEEAEKLAGGKDKYKIWGYRGISSQADA